MRVFLIFLFVASLGVSHLKSQNADSTTIAKIFNEALTRGHSYARLGELCKTIGHRLSGSDAAEKGIQWGTNMLESYSFDSVFTQSVMVPRWERGDVEELWLSSQVLGKQIKKKQIDYNCETFLEQQEKPRKKYRLQACVLGGSVGTQGKLTAGLVVVYSNKELDSLGMLGQLKGKIVLFNRAFDQALINTFSAYGACVGQRFSGASQAAVYGAAAVLVRSMTNKCDLHPHTGSMGYKEGVPKIPAMAVASAVADMLALLLASEPELTLTMNLNCRTLADRESANVIAQTVGSEMPDKYIVFGGHFDSWDEGEGAHDDGAGCMHAFEALRILKMIGYTPRHTLRCVWWINEENGLRGATEYARLAGINNETHIAALESDRGGFTPRGFGMDSVLFSDLEKYRKWFLKYGCGEFTLGGGGADIGPLKKLNSTTQLVSFIPDSQRYFDVHHAETDIFENVNKRELELGAAAIAALIYVIDQEMD